MAFAAASVGHAQGGQDARDDAAEAPAANDRAGSESEGAAGDEEERSRGELTGQEGSGPGDDTPSPSDSAPRPTGEGSNESTHPAGNGNAPAASSATASEDMGHIDSPLAEETVQEEEASTGTVRIEYVLESIEVRGNQRTDSGVIRSFVPMAPGEVLDIDDPRIEVVRFRLIATGWFEDVRLGLERGEAPGRVLLVVSVQERNTFLVEGLSLGFSEGVFSSDDPNVTVDPYFGITLSELNLFGTGVGLSVTGLLSVPQQGVRVRTGTANLGGTELGLYGSLFFNNGREFFGNDDVLIARAECPPPDPDGPRCEESRNAVLVYRRYGGSVGTGFDLSPSVRFSLDWQLEAVEVVDRPEAASHRRGTEIVPIDFSINDGLSWVSAVTLGLVIDERDNPALPTSGRHITISSDLSSAIVASDYQFARVQIGWREWFRLPDAHHTLRLGLFAGGAFGDVPFFYKFYVADLSDLIPSRVLELNLDRRAPRDLFGTAVREMRAQELAGRLDVEYSLWLYEGRNEIRGLILYGLVGVYALMDLDDLRVAIPGYQGAARIPIDLTFDLGLRLDTAVGVFQLGLSTAVGFISL